MWYALMHALANPLRAPVVLFGSVDCRDYLELNALPFIQCDAIAAIRLSTIATMVEFDVEDDTGTPHGSPGASSPAVDAAFFLSVWSSHGVRS